MKNTIIISLLCLGALSTNAQNKYTTNDHPNLRVGERIQVTPAFSEPFTVISEPACYMYKKKVGLVVLECPGVLFAPPEVVAQAKARPYMGSSETVTADNAYTVEHSGTYMGYYPSKYKIDASVPANAVPATPTTPYILLQNPPCYKYKTKKGLEVMECHGVWFPPEDVK